MYSLFSRKKMIIILLVGQTLCVFILGFFTFFESFLGVSLPFKLSEYIQLVLILLGLIVISSFIVIVEVIKIMENEAQVELSRIQLEELRDSNLILKEKQHDVKNHFQVLMGFLQLDKKEAAEDYIKEVIDDINTSTEMIDSLDLPESLRMLIANKKALAKDNDIKFDVNINGKISNYDVDVFDLIRVLGNLLKNAFHATQNANVSERKVCLDISESDGQLQIDVINNGYPIPEGIKPKMFERGVSTKGKDGSGIGLYIVKKLIEKNGGKTFLVNSDKEETRFRIVFGKN